MNSPRPGSIPREPVPKLHGIPDDLRTEWHSRVPDPEICVVLGEDVLYTDGVGFTDFDKVPLDAGSIPTELLTSEYQDMLGKQVTALRFLGSVSI